MIYLLLFASYNARLVLGELVRRVDTADRR